MLVVTELHRMVAGGNLCREEADGERNADATSGQ
jgi:hypothetical protein